MSLPFDNLHQPSNKCNGYTSFVGKYVTGRRKRFRPHKVYTQFKGVETNQFSFNVSLSGL